MNVVSSGEGTGVAESLGSTPVFGRYSAPTTRTVGGRSVVTAGARFDPAFTLNAVVKGLGASIREYSVMSIRQELIGEVNGSD